MGPQNDVKRLPENYVDLAEDLMKKQLKSDRFGNPCFDITTSQIRKILSVISVILNEENLSRDENLSERSYNNLQMARVRIAYDAGREEKVKRFVMDTSILDYIKGVGRSRKEFIRFAHYVESLVAWHRFMGEGKQ